MKRSTATLWLFAMLLSAPVQADDGSASAALIDAIVAEAAARLNLPAPSVESSTAQELIGVPAQSPERRFVTTTTGGTLADALGMNSRRPVEVERPPAIRQLLDLQGRRGSRIRHRRQALYQTALKEMVDEHQRVTLVPYESILELSKLTGQRPERIRQDLFRVVANETE